MLDDFDTPLCDKKHYGPILQFDADAYVMRCSFCNQLFRAPLESDRHTNKGGTNEQAGRSSNICIQACDWDVDGDMVKCRSCSYIGPLP
jgi:uncharacterized C2H2 Zn-finger protein